MGKEIERKFLLASERWREEVERSTPMVQGYLAGSAEASVRVRISGEQAHLNLKSATLGIERDEFEYEIPLADGKAILKRLCGERTIEKTRHYVKANHFLWEIDEFSGANQGLIVAEVELDATDTVLTLPDWIGEDVSADPRYYNVALVENPYGSWG
ncbi:MAG: CYTH domain-containing protein [Pseudomonadota bacterium]